MHITILGAGISGLSAAIALTQSLSSVKIIVHEIRSAPQTIGGAVNLTPNALRYLSRLGVLPKLAGRFCPVDKIEIASHRTGAYLGCINFDFPASDGFKGMRVRRAEVLRASVERWKELGGEIRFGSRAISIEKTQDEKVKVEFEGGVVEMADLVLGCDGIQSFVRTTFVQPERKPVYSGVAAAYGLLQCGGIDLSSLEIEATKLFSSRRGSLLLSYTNPGKTQLYVAAVMETAEVGSREGWKAKGADQVAVRKDIFDRFCKSGPLAAKLGEVVEKVDDWFLFPVYKLPPHGIWSRGNVLLIGDAAHAVSRTRRALLISVLLLTSTADAAPRRIDRLGHRGRHLLRPRPRVPCENR
jgi:2-polyprenyl-6-methoxyphenol hydroxylase-like FAD-dependent oxidoreductase